MTKITESVKPLKIKESAIHEKMGVAKSDGNWSTMFALTWASGNT
jgi:hypothetical protein